MAEFDKNNKKHLVTLQGSQYITFVGLQARLVDQKKYIVGTYTEVLIHPTKENNNRAEVGVTVSIKKDGSPDTFNFHCVGDADPNNVSKNLANATLRMAETRATSRALRLATRSDFTAWDEMPPMDNNNKENSN